MVVKETFQQNELSLPFGRERITPQPQTKEVVVASEVLKDNKDEREQIESSLRYIEAIKKQNSEKEKLKQYKVPFLHKKSEVLALTKNFVLHPFSSLSSEKVRFIHYPQLYLLPTVPLALSVPFIDLETGLIYSAIYSASVLASIIESRIHKQNAVDLEGNLEAMIIHNPKKKEFLDGKTVEERDKVIELHWVPGKREKTDNKRLLILKTSLQFIESLLDLRELLLQNDPRFDGIDAIRMTSALIQESLSLFRGETNPITNNRFLKILDHLGTRVNMLMNLNFRAAFLEPVKTSQTAWITRDNFIKTDTKTYLENKAKRIKKLIAIQEKNTKSDNS